MLSANQIDAHTVYVSLSSRYGRTYLYRIQLNKIETRDEIILPDIQRSRNTNQDADVNLSSNNRIGLNYCRSDFSVSSSTLSDDNHQRGFFAASLQRKSSALTEDDNEEFNGLDDNSSTHSSAGDDNKTASLMTCVTEIFQRIPNHNVDVVCVHEINHENQEEPSALQLTCSVKCLPQALYVGMASGTVWKYRLSNI